MTLVLSCRRPGYKAGEGQKFEITATVTEQTQFATGAKLQKKYLAEYRCSPTAVVEYGRKYKLAQAQVHHWICAAFLPDVGRVVSTSARPMHGAVKASAMLIHATTGADVGTKARKRNGPQSGDTLWASAPLQSHRDRSIQAGKPATAEGARTPDIKLEIADAGPHT